MVFRILRPDSALVWDNEELRTRFPRYRGILDDKEIARYIIAKSIKCDFDTNDSIRNLENLLVEKSKEFNLLLNKSTEIIENKT
ncbi:MAG: hypothetical protein ACTSQU_07955 [Promethearchaeota archaeon]